MSILEDEFSVEVGRLLCGRVRDYLAAAKFRGAKIEWFESSGFIVREFVVKGEFDDVSSIRQDFAEWMQQMGRGNEN